MSDLPDLRNFVRPEPLPRDASVAVRGGPDSEAKIRSHAQRLQRAFVLDGMPVLGISVFVAIDDIGPASLDGIRGGRLATYRLVHVVPLEHLLAAGLVVLPTFARPHATVVLDTLDLVDLLVELLGPPTLNPQYGGNRRTRRRTP